MIKKLVVLLLSIVGFAAIYSTTSNITFRDSSEYVFASENLKNKNCLYAGDLSKPMDFRLFSKRPVVYPLVLAFNPLTMRLVQFLLFVLLIFGVLSLLRRNSFSNKKLSTFLWFLIFTPLMLLHPGFIMADFVFSCCLFFFFYALIYTGLNSWDSILWWIVAVLIKPALFPTVIIWLFAIAFQIVKSRKLHVKLFLPLLVVVAVFIRNYQTAGVKEYSSISTINLVHYNAKLAVAKVYGLDSANNFVNGALFSIPETARAYQSYSKNLKDLGQQTIVNNKLGYIIVHTLGAIKMVLDPGRFELYAFVGLSDEESLTELIFSGKWSALYNKLLSRPTTFAFYLALFLVSLIKLVLVSALLFSKPFWKEPLIVLSLLFVAYCLGITGPVGAGRFFLPVVMMYNLLAVEGLYRFQKGSKG